jgi:hypothetical protein
MLAGQVCVLKDNFRNCHSAVAIQRCLSRVSENLLHNSAGGRGISSTTAVFVLALFALFAHV